MTDADDRPITAYRTAHYQNGTILHADPECDRLGETEDVREVDPAAYRPLWDWCRTCTGAHDPEETGREGGETERSTLAWKLQAADSIEDALAAENDDGELVTDGGQSADGIERLDGTCPTCGGQADVFPRPDEDRGHVYCSEDDCGWIHRDLLGVSEYIDAEPDQDLVTDGGRVQWARADAVAQRSRAGIADQDATCPHDDPECARPGGVPCYDCFMTGGED